MKNLNPPQLQAVKVISKPCLVLAGAGSGKTRVITQKIAYLVQHCGIKAAHIAAVTFTNKAAKEMKERVGQVLPKADSRGLTVSTFHNLGLNILRKECTFLGLRSGFSIFDQEDSKSLLKELMLQHADTDADLVDVAQHAIGQLKNAMLLPVQALSQAADAKETQIAHVYAAYQQALTAYNAVDFDDLINLPVQLFQQHPEVLARWQSRIRYLLVDEYQDTNGSQYELVRLLVGERHCLTVVGDDDQSIYAWRGARPENLQRLEQDFPHLELIKLEQNYRSTSVILTCANALIANNPHAFEKKLWSDLAYGESLRVIQCADDKAEAERVVNEILTRRMSRDDKFSDYAILYRGNHQSRLLEMALRTEGLPYKVSGGTAFFSRAEIRDIMAYLRLLVNPADDNAMLRIINVPRRKIGSSTLQILSQYAAERETSLFDAIDEFGLDSRLPEGALKSLREFTAWMQRVLYQCEEVNPISAVREMITDINYEDWLLQTSTSAGVAEKRMQNVWFLVSNLTDALAKEQEEDDTATIKDAINRLLLRDLMERQNEEEETDAIQLLTLHAAKGLEYPQVFIVGMEEDLLPHRSSIEADTIEEERRLAYVGITRARENLTFTYVAKRRQFGETVDVTPSRFLDEIPSEHLIWEGRGEASSANNIKKGKETFAGLKGLFD